MWPQNKRKKEKKSVPNDQRSSFGDLELSSLVTTPPSGGSCSLIGRIVCVAVAVRDAGTEQ